MAIVGVARGFWQICLAIITVRAGGFLPYWAAAVQRIDVPLCEHSSPPKIAEFFFGYLGVIKYRKLCASATVAMWLLPSKAAPQSQSQPKLSSRLEPGLPPGT